MDGDRTLDLIDQELARLRERYPDKARWYEWRRRHWIEGVKITRAVAARALGEIRQVYLDDKVTMRTSLVPDPGADDPVTEPHAGAVQLIGELRNRLGVMPVPREHPALDDITVAYVARYHLDILERLVRLHYVTVNPRPDS